MKIITVFAALFLLLQCGNSNNENESTLGKPISALRQISDTVLLPQKITAAPADVPLQGYDTARHKKKLAEIKKNKYDVVLIGNSIIHTLGEFGGKYKPLKAVWDRHFRKRRSLNLGYSGYRTENILWNLQNGELDFRLSPKVILLLIGTNNTDDRRFKTTHTAEEVLTGTKAIVELIKKRHPSSKILIVRIFPRGSDKDKGSGKNIFYSSTTCIKTAEKAGALTKSLSDDKQVFWVDVGKVFLNRDSTINSKLMPDLLHPNAAGAEAWVGAIEPLLSKLLDKKADKKSAIIKSTGK